MRKIREREISSLELLLDTMCNTFGGIVFIALLLALLSRAAGITEHRQRQPKERVQAELTELEQILEVDRLREKRRILSAELERRRALTAGGDKNLAENQAKLAALSNSNQALQVEVASLAAECEQLERTNRLYNNDLQEYRVNREELEAQISELDRRLTSETRDRQRPLRLPRVHAVAKLPVWFAIRYGKFYAIDELNTVAWRRDKFDTADVEVVSGSGQFVVEVRPAGGMSVAKGTRPQGKLALALRNLDPDIHCPHFAVYADSFAEFNVVKQLFVERGFEYNWHPQEGAILLVLTPEVKAQ